MRLLSRLTDIVSANLNELIERYEDPELLLKQAVCEMDESLRAALENAVKVVAHEKLLARQLAAEEAAAGSWHAQATAAVQRGDEEAARAALRNKRERESVIAKLSQQLAEATAAGQTLRRDIEALRLRTDEARRKLTLLAARQRAAEARQRLLREFNAAPLGDEAFAKFERMCRKVEAAEAEAEALAELSGRKLPQPPAPETADVEAELKELKATCGA
jgi:phage shock protein A